MKSLYDALKAVQSLVSAVRTADANGTGVDTKGFNSAIALIDVGTVDETDTDETYVFKVQESSDNGSSDAFADISGASVTVTTSNDNQVHKIRIEGLGTSRERYLRVVLDVGGTTPSAPCSAAIILGNAYNDPQS